ncbi:MAG: DUF6777 domain-containing protein, partial [Egibacteraceae bacterium]
MRDLSGSRLGQYELKKVIGRGGTATVYEAYQPALNRLVAVKTLDGFDDPHLVARFRREAESIARLQHRNILPIYDFGDQDGLLYFAVQYVEGGRTLGDLSKSAIDPVRAIELVRHLLAGLAYAHQRGIVHRDVKPSNVLLGEPDWPLLADFGVAKLLADRATRLTGHGVAIGTLAYMSPEQALNQRVDARSDLYAIGVILYELFTGQVPFEADTPPVVLLQHINTPPRPPRQLNPAIPPDVEAVMMRALEKDPNKRYQDAVSMSQALSRLHLFRAQRTSAVPISPASEGDRPAYQAGAGSPGPHPGGDRQRTPAPAGAGGSPPPGAPPPPPGWGAIPPPPHRRGSRMGMRLIAGAASLVLVGGLLSLFAFNRARGHHTEGEVVLEATASLGVDPFTPNVTVPRPRGAAGAAPPVARVTPTPTVGHVVTAQSGSTPGLYGGSRENANCNVQQLAIFLTTNQDKGRAWVSALNGDPTLEWSGGKSIRVDQIPLYLRELTPLVLRHDVRVTNHGFAGDRPTPRQSVLQAGTAVLVDKFGVPRVRCACGNPLIPMKPTATRPVYQGPQWVRFNPVQVIVIQPAPTVINNFVIININTGEQHDRDPGYRPPPCDDIDQDGRCDPPCPDENRDGFCDKPCKDADGDGNCDQPCPDRNNNGYCDDNEPPPCPEGDANRNGICDDDEPACPNGDANGDGICDDDGCPLDADGDGICDNRDDDVCLIDADADGICDNRDDDVCLIDADADGICDNRDDDVCLTGDADGDRVCDEVDLDCLDLDNDNSCDPTPNARLLDPGPTDPGSDAAPAPDDTAPAPDDTAPAPDDTAPAPDDTAPAPDDTAPAPGLADPGPCPDADLDGVCDDADPAPED